MGAPKHIFDFGYVASVLKSQHLKVNSTWVVNRGHVLAPFHRTVKVR